MTPIIPPDQIPLIRDALAIGIENTEELLIIHDRDLGRSGRKNRTEAERLEAELTTLRTAFDMLCLPA